jgi:hypothetical protein
MNRTCSAGSVLKAPVKVVVSVVEPCFWMPRMAMHICSASIITATPRGFSVSSMDLAAEDLHHAGDLGKAQHPAVRKVGDMRLADDRHHMVLAMREERNVFHQHHVVIAGDFLEGAAEHVLGGKVIAGEELAIGLGDAFRRIDEALALRIVAGPAEQHANGVFRLFLRGAAGIILDAGKIGDYGVHGPIDLSAGYLTCLSDSPLAIRLTLQAWVPLAGSGAFESSLISATDRPARFPKQQVMVRHLQNPHPNTSYHIVSNNHCERGPRRHAVLFSRRGRNNLLGSLKIPQKARKTGP